VTASHHPKKNQHLCKAQDHSTDDVGEGQKPPHFPIRAIDFDKEEGMLYTGDEMGYLIKWDITVLIEKMKAITQLKQEEAADEEAGEEEEEGEGKKVPKNKATFVTGMTDNWNDKVEFKDEDIKPLLRFRAHQDLINFISFVPDCG